MRALRSLIKGSSIGVEEARSVLTHYFSVLDGDSRASFLECGNLSEKISLAREILGSCAFCERKCGADRASGVRGYCGVLEPRVSSQFIHPGEEPEIIPSYTIFFAGCTFKCVFCQNWDTSQDPSNGVQITAEKLAAMILETAGLNVNWVGGDPTPNIPYMLEVLSLLDRSIPQVWNSNMYLTLESMSLLEGVIDLYLTDFKYGNDRCGKRLSDAPGYFDVVSRNHLMASQQADMIIRHLVMPGHVECCSKPVLDWIGLNLGDSVRVNVMDQYRPEYRASRINGIDRRLSSDEFNEVWDYAVGLGLGLTG
ncbi:MAG: radical SAM protein [Candidatus Altiarchaeota archaeon]